MASINFYLKKSADKKKEALIVISISVKIDGKFIKMNLSTGEKILPIQWNQRKQVSKLPELNNFLNQLKEKSEEILRKGKSENVQDLVEYFKNNWNAPSPNVKEIEIQDKKRDFYAVFEDYLESEKHKRTKGTIVQKKSALNHFRKFSKIYKYPLNFETITLEFYDLFLSYCFNDAGIKNGQAGNLIKQLKAFLNWATDRGINKNLDFLKKTFKKLKDEPEVIYLTESELMNLYNSELLPGKLANTRDFFCFGCFTGLRFSDIRNLSPDNIVVKDVLIGGKLEQIKFIETRVQKTKDRISQPLNKYAEAILKKHEGNHLRCFNMVSEQKTNQHLKEIAKIVGFDRIVRKTNYQGANPIIIKKPLDEMITFHMSKKTFMTLFLSKGGSLQTAMSFTGNKDYRTAKRYYEIEDVLKTTEMQKIFT